ncbi:hypothetical protein EFY87_02260 [Flexivirga caeni]|uniref:Uncharacterized protein n=1 Tax=Flexivirga caeni TaxID=2294115 RepID=A0A3M9MIV0_9MICO|nr:hypothetical protein EFY87_02260 [Flexivirga caeni]
MAAVRAAGSGTSAVGASSSSGSAYAACGAGSSATGGAASPASSAFATAAGSTGRNALTAAGAGAAAVSVGAGGCDDSGGGRMLCVPSAASAICHSLPSGVRPSTRTVRPAAYRSARRRASCSNCS